MLLTSDNCCSPQQRAAAAESVYHMTHAVLYSYARMRGLTHTWHRVRSRSSTSQHPEEQKPNNCTVTAAVVVEKKCTRYSCSKVIGTKQSEQQQQQQQQQRQQQHSSSTEAAAQRQQPRQSIRMYTCLLYTSPSPRDGLLSRMPSSA